MEATAGYRILPEFLSGAEGSLFIQRFVPDPMALGGTCIIVPPFLEEMNRSRRTMALLGSSLACRGITVILPDLFGTGDSAGEFGSARWSTWLKDLRLVSHHYGGPIPPLIVGLRAGCLLAAGLAETTGASRLVLVQPVSYGRSFLKQFFRQATASAIAGNESAMSAGEITNALEDGRPVEIGGYEVGPQLYAQMMQAQLADSKPSCPVHWIEIGAQETVPPGAQRAAEEWTKRMNVEIEIDIVNDPPFWRTQEISVGQNCIVRAVDVLSL
jgi:exosortase A-associated hydrolase 2